MQGLGLRDPGLAEGPGLWLLSAYCPFDSCGEKEPCRARGLKGSGLLFRDFLDP